MAPDQRAAYCNGCERTKRLRADGTFQRHTVRTLSILCPGSGLTPDQANRRNLWDTASSCEQRAANNDLLGPNYPRLGP